MTRPSLSRAATAAFCLLLGVPQAGARSAPPGEEPVTVLVAASSDSSGVRVTVAFSRTVGYRLEESRSRLRLLIDEPVSEGSEMDRRVDGDVIRRIRLDLKRRGGEVVFYLGDEFSTFSSSESSAPFRVVFEFNGRDAAIAPGTPARELSPMPPPQEPRPVGASIGEPQRVVIDPGHGGDEEGAVSRGGLKEKELVLDLARRLAELLRSQGYEVELTRDADQALDLATRTAFANNRRADLFLSIHANWSVRSGARGAETYFLSKGATDEEALAVARAENRPGLDAGNPDPERPEIGLVLWEMAQAEHLVRSSLLADMIQDEMNQLAGIRDRGVKQAPFRVLVGADMPAVLVEVGFLSNEDEERELAGSDYRDRIASAIVSAVGRFGRRIRAEGEYPAGAPPGSPR